MKIELPIRKPTRLKGFDYNSAGAYFITICTDKRQQILSHINVGGDVPGAPKNIDPEKDICIELLPCGKIADKYINQLNDFYDNLEVNQYVIMPDHIHILLFVRENTVSSGAPRTSPPTNAVTATALVPQFVSTFKRFCNKEFGYNIWQRGFNDHIIRNEKDYDLHLQYIYNNPVCWYYNELYPLSSP